MNVATSEQSIRVEYLPK